MANLYRNKDRATIVSVAATEATDATTYYYVNMASYRYLGAHFEWTAGGGTVIVTVEASMQEAANPTAAASIDYQDVNTAAFGVASFTDDFLFSDDDGFFTPIMWVRFKVVVASSGVGTKYCLDAVVTNS